MSNQDIVYPLGRCCWGRSARADILPKSKPQNFGRHRKHEWVCLPQLPRLHKHIFKRGR